jgi:hypothetical protein
MNLCFQKYYQAVVDEEEESQLCEVAHVDVGDQTHGGESQSLEIWKHEMKNESVFAC